MTRFRDEAAVGRLAEVIGSLPAVRLAYFFGSRARGTGRDDSDFDIALLLDAGQARSFRGPILRGLIGRLGQAVASHLIDLVILNGAPVLLRQRVLRDGRLLYQRSDAERVRFATQTIREYQDGEVRRREFMERRIQRLKAGESDGRSRDLLEKARSVGKLLGQAREVS